MKGFAAGVTVTLVYYRGRVRLLRRRLRASGYILASNAVRKETGACGTERNTAKRNAEDGPD